MKKENSTCSCQIWSACCQICMNFALFVCYKPIFIILLYTIKDMYSIAQNRCSRTTDTAFLITRILLPCQKKTHYYHPHNATTLDNMVRNVSALAANVASRCWWQPPFYQMSCSFLWSHKKVLSYCFTHSMCEIGEP